MSCTTCSLLKEDGETLYRLIYSLVSHLTFIMKEVVGGLVND